MPGYRALGFTRMQVAGTRLGGGRVERKLIPLSSNEIRRLFAKLVLTARYHVGHILHWSGFRRLCQDQARAAHYRKRLEPP